MDNYGNSPPPPPQILINNYYIIQKQGLLETVEEDNVNILGTTIHTITIINQQLAF